MHLLIPTPATDERGGQAPVDMGHRYYIKIIPEIDMPGHMKAALAPSQNQRFRLTDSDGRVHDSVLDWSRPAGI